MKALVIVASGLHIGYVGCYGNDWIATTALDRLAAEGIVFDQHFAEHPHSVGAYRGWQTGRYDFPLPDEKPVRKQPEVPNLVQLFSENGVRTVLITNRRESLPEEQLAGWAEVHRPPAEQPLEVVRKALARLAGVDPWLLWLDLADLLPPWNVPDQIYRGYLQSPELDDWDEEPMQPVLNPVPDPLGADDTRTFLRLQASYAAAVTEFGGQLEVLLDDLQERKLLEDILLLITSDCGQVLGDPHPYPPPGSGEGKGGGRDWCPWLHEELIHVPMIMRLPGKAKAGLRISAFSQHVDVLPTLLEAFALAVPAIHGYSLLPLVCGKTDHVRHYACAGLRIGASVEWALRTPQWSLLSLASEPPRRPRLYVKPDDRWEVNDVAQHYLELAEQLEQTLRSFVEATRRPGLLQLRGLAAEVAAKPSDATNPTDGGTPS